MVALLRKPSRLSIVPQDERRMFPRTEAQGLIQGRRLDHSLDALRFPQISLSLRDVSVGGLCATSAMPLQCGERLGVSFPADAGQLPWTAMGRVVRCQPSASGYRVALEFDTLPAA